MLTEDFAEFLQLDPDALNPQLQTDYLHRNTVLQSPLYRLNQLLDAFERAHLSSPSSTLANDPTHLEIRQELTKKIHRLGVETLIGLVIYALTRALRTYPDLRSALTVRLHLEDTDLASVCGDLTSNQSVFQALAHGVIPIESLSMFELLNEEAQNLVTACFKASVGSETDEFAINSCLAYTSERLAAHNKTNMDQLPPDECARILAYIRSKFSRTLL